MHTARRKEPNNFVELLGWIPTMNMPPWRLMMTLKPSILVARSILFATFLMTVLLGLPGISRAGVVAFDMVGSASQNLVSFTDDPAIPFGSAADGFNKFQRGVSWVLSRPAIRMSSSG